MKYLQLNDIGCYKRALKLANYVWDIVATWDWFARKTVGVQFVTSMNLPQAHACGIFLFLAQASPAEAGLPSSLS